jgi:hypothetical protein
MKIATVNAQNAGLQIRPIWPAVSWNASLMAGSISPRTANTMAVVTNDTQLVTKSFDLFIRGAILT